MAKDTAADISESDLHSLEEIEALKRSFMNQAKEAFGLDFAAEYRKKMEENRIADRKNGHLVDEPEAVVVFSRREHHKKQSESSSATQIQAAARVFRRSARVSQRVAEFESHSSSRVLGKTTLYVAADERGERKSTTLVTQNDNLNLQGDRAINSFCLGDAKKGEIAAVQCGEKGLFYPPIPTTESPSLGGSDIYHKDNFNCLGKAESGGLTAVQGVENALFHSTKDATVTPILGGSEKSGTYPLSIH